ncbi:MAG: energy transducer TonB [Sphingobacteriales bacterium JAD_PAG50586_3]|nr:MAG: energy transducer TonB [Sphingobacteriales bacterium JAD_PAG50586_3]
MDQEIKNIELSIICGESWEAMQPVAQGRHCNKCNRKVIDLTNSSQLELEKAQTENPNGFCGSFRLSQTLYSRAAATLLLAAGLSFSANVLKAQTPADSSKLKLEHTTDKDPIVFGGMPIMPTYKHGGEEGLLKFLAKNISIEDLDIYGTVYVNFTIDTLGNVINPKILRGIHPTADNEALRVVKLLQFTPGIENGRKVEVVYNIPIKFRR